MSILLAAGCTRDELPMVKDCKVTVDFSVKGPDTLTKALLNEWGIVDVNIYFIDKRGNVITHVFSPSPQPVECEIYTGLEYTVYSIANTGRNIDVDSYEELMNLVLHNSYFTTSCVPFASVAGPYLIKKGQNLSLIFTRLVSKVTVTADFSQLNDDVSIDIKEVRLRNIPVSTQPFAINRITRDSQVADGDPYTNPSESNLRNGISFYILENMQGNLLEGNLSQQGKVLPQDSPFAEFCSYLEVQASYVSSDKQGDVTYKYYLGKDNVANFDIERNTLFNLKLFFKGNGGIDENTWRVDVKELLLTL